MKKCIYALILLILFLGVSGCNVFLTYKTERVSGVPDTSENNIESTQMANETTVTRPTNAPGHRPGQHTYEIKASLHESMPEYRFVATGIVKGPENWMFGYVLGLDVYDETGKPILSADFSEVSEDGEVTGFHVFNEMMDTMGLHVTDVNFDGYKDVIILNSFAGAHANTWYNCWLWDAKTTSFVESRSFAEICNPALDAEKKCIYSAGGSSAAFWGGRIYKFIDGEFVLTNELDTNENGLVERALVDGEWKIVREVYYGEDNQILEREQEYYRNSELWQLGHPHWYWVGGHHAGQWLD